MDLPPQLPLTNPLEQHLAFFQQHLSDSIAADARIVQAAAHKLQHACADRGRVHVIYEALTPNPTDSTKPPELAFANVIYSPTISFDGPAGISAAAQLTNALRSIADGLKPPPPLPGLAAQHNVHSMHTNGNMRSVLPYTQLHTLDWYPGQRFVAARSEWMREKVQVGENTYNRFSHLGRRETETMYQRLFGRMYRAMKPRIPSEKGPLRYWRFTPPWLRKNISIGNLNIILDSESMPELRSQRNRMGERRLKAVLAAFFEREVLARGILEDLLGKQPPSPTLARALQLSSGLSNSHTIGVTPVQAAMEEQDASMSGDELYAPDAPAEQNVAQALQVPDEEETSNEARVEGGAEGQVGDDRMESNERLNVPKLEEMRHESESDEAQKGHEEREAQQCEEGGDG